MNNETKRLDETRRGGSDWKKWGPYLSERQWGTVREDYSENGDSWKYFTHDQARSRAYRWGEDGLAGISDSRQRLCFALALWNGQDPIIKERLFGLDNSEGNHGEDVKEYYFYLDNTPTHSYMKWLYKYPQSPYPYEKLITTNAGRSRREPEYELLDTGIFDNDRYFDVFVEYAKVKPEDILIRITAHNRGPEKAELYLLPTLWFRNTWSWSENSPKPSIRTIPGKNKINLIEAEHEELGTFHLFCEEKGQILFTENETNLKRLFGKPNRSPYVKDGINDYFIRNEKHSINPKNCGTKAAISQRLVLSPGKSKVVRLRLSKTPIDNTNQPFGDYFDSLFNLRKKEADEFYATVIPDKVSPDEKLVMRQAFAGMLWTKQYYYFDANRWLEEHGANPFKAESRLARNKNWFHMVNDHVISMPDKWEYPWYASWDLAFHAIAFSPIDLDFAKEQLLLVLSEQYMHPNCQIPAYEWNFNDVNPPVHAWATLFIYRSEQYSSGKEDLDFLKKAFGKLLLNFTWWVNRKDRFGKNVFEGGFLGMDNIGVFDRSSPLPKGGYLEQADGTAWMALFCQNLFEIALELAYTDPLLYEDFAIKFADHFFWIAAAMNRVGRENLWDDADGFYYDLLRLPDEYPIRLKVRSMVGLLPLCATTFYERGDKKFLPRLRAHVKDLLARFPEVAASVFTMGTKNTREGKALSSVLTEDKLRKILAIMLDEDEFFGPYGIRSISRYHDKHPFRINVNNQHYEIRYIPGESESGMFGGNSNWRGPVWFSANVLLIRALLNLFAYFGNDFKIKCPTSSGKLMNLFEVAQEIVNRLTKIFLKDRQDNRPIYNNQKKFQKDPHWKNNILFYEYFHGDTGVGLGASHQTGWTGVVAVLIKMFATVNPEVISKEGHKAVFKKTEGVIK